MKNYGFTATRAIIVKGYVTANSEEEAQKKILAGEYDDIIDEYENDDIEEVIEVWEAK